jgi:hypothetical protein
LDRAKTRMGGVVVSVLDYVAAQIIARDNGRQWVRVYHPSALPVGGGTLEPYRAALGLPTEYFVTSPGAAPAPAVAVELVQDKNTGQWRACVWGRGAAILRPVPGNTSPAHAATWATEADARAELPALCGCAINVVRVTAAT